MTTLTPSPIDSPDPAPRAPTDPPGPAEPPEVVPPSPAKEPPGADDTPTKEPPQGPDTVDPPIRDPRVPGQPTRKNAAIPIAVP
jgi:hypothetical protein